MSRTKPGALLSVDGPVAVITLVNPPVNALHPDGARSGAVDRHASPMPHLESRARPSTPCAAVIRDVFTHLQEVQRRSDVRAIVVTGANGEWACTGVRLRAGCEAGRALQTKAALRRRGTLDTAAPAPGCVRCGGSRRLLHLAPPLPHPALRHSPLTTIRALPPHSPLAPWEWFPPHPQPATPTHPPGRFCAGFDISQFAKGAGLDQDVNRLICDLLESGPKPTVAAIEGMALGGGLEVAMGCNARVCAPGELMGGVVHKAAGRRGVCGVVWCGGCFGG